MIYFGVISIICGIGCVWYLKVTIAPQMMDIRATKVYADSYFGQFSEGKDSASVCSNLERLQLRFDSKRYSPLLKFYKRSVSRTIEQYLNMLS